VSARGDVPRRLRERVEARSGLADGDAVVVAVSGGLDSVALVHLLRFTPGIPKLRLVVAHVDHAMRPSSADDAAWVRGLARAWGLSFQAVRLDPAPTSESGARRARYAFLRDVRERENAALIATAHHADDQAETVLFRVVRGTGIRGLAGIPERRGHLWRPLLPFRRSELEAYAHAAGLGWRDDPTNQSLDFARNALRHRVLPSLESMVAPGTRRALIGLARRARQEEEAWASLVPRLLEGLDVRREEGRVSLSWKALEAYHPTVRTRLLRTLARTLGSPLDEAGTHAALEFTSRGKSGRERHLSGGLTVRREFERLLLVRTGVPDDDRTVLIQGPSAGDGRLVVGGKPFHVKWGSGSPPGGWQEAFSVEEVRFPVRVRGWAPGDRLRLSYGTKKLKKVFLEARTPVGDRHRVPVVVDAAGRVMWVAGVARSCLARSAQGQEALYIAITDVDTD